MNDIIGLYHDLVRAAIDPISIREIICAAAGLKVTRLCTRDQRRAVLESILPRYGMKTKASAVKFAIACDTGKGGWANRISRLVAQDATDGYRMFYISIDPATPAKALAADAGRADAALGEMLGIPACCRSFYDRYAAVAFSSHGDFTPFTFENTARRYPYNFWNNSVCKYFGYSFLSFFPCSFNCVASAEVARETYDVLRSVNHEFADTFLDYHRRSVLYSEEEGIFIFTESFLADRTLFYKGVTSTASDSHLARCVRAGNALELTDDQNVTIMRDKVPLLKRSDKEILLGVFS